MKKKMILGFAALTVFCGSLALSISLNDQSQNVMAEGAESSITVSSISETSSFESTSTVVDEPTSSTTEGETE